MSESHSRRRLSVFRYCKKPHAPSESSVSAKRTARPETRQHKGNNSFQLCLTISTLSASIFSYPVDPSPPQRRSASGVACTHDTHYLLHIYDLMRDLLLSKPNDNENADPPLLESHLYWLALFLLGNISHIFFDLHVLMKRMKMPDFLNFCNRTSLLYVLMSPSVLQSCFLSCIILFGGTGMAFLHLITGVYKRNYDVCMQLYEKELFTENSYLNMYGLPSAGFNAQQLAIVAVSSCLLSFAS
uniref:Uncharacterized protein n=1 Tax=Salix viminalis TaxID=40686 RepID=A0A6N2MCU3_SALVM